MTTKILLRRDTSATWTAVNPLLGPGEPGYEKDTGRLKIGNGVDFWNDLEYFLPEVDLTAAIETAIANAGIGGGGAVPVALANHINSPEPHPVYDDGPSLALLYSNAKV